MPWMRAQADLQKLRTGVGDLVALSTPSSTRHAGVEQAAAKITDAVISYLDVDVAYLAFSVRGEPKYHEVIRFNPDIVDYASCLDAIRAYVHAPALTEDITSPVFLVESLGTRLVCKTIQPDAVAKLVVASRNPDFPSDAQHILLDVAAGQLAQTLERQWMACNAKRMATLVEHSPDFIGIADLEGRATYVNAAGMTLVGLDSLDQLQSLRIFDFVANEDQPRLRNHIWDEMKRHGRWIGELRFCHFKTKALIPVLLDGFVIEDPEKSVPMNIATVTRDLTAQRRTEAELRSLNEALEQRVIERTGALEQANRRLMTVDASLEEAQMELFRASRLSAAGQMAAALAHELNQPLTAVTNSVNAGRRMIANNGLKSSLLTQIMDEAAEEALRAGEIIRRLRDFVERGETDRRIENLSRLIEEASALALTGSEALGVDVRFHADQRAVHALVDRIQVQQVIVNLIRNALEAMCDCERRELEVRTLLLDPETVEITVADTGIGLSGRTRDHLFEPFFSTNRNGMGLGLSICQSIVKRHGGKIRTRPNPGGGTIFSFTLTAVAKERSPDDV